MQMAPPIRLGLWWCHAIVLVSTVGAVGAVGTVGTFGWHACICASLGLSPPLSRSWGACLSPPICRVLCWWPTFAAVIAGWCVCTGLDTVCFCTGILLPLCWRHIASLRLAVAIVVAQCRCCSISPVFLLPMMHVYASLGFLPYVAGWLCVHGHRMKLAVHGIGGACLCGRRIVACPFMFLALHTCVLH